MKVKNWRVLIACTGIAVLCWLLNVMGRNYISEINYPINIVYKVSAKRKKRPRKIPTKVLIKVNGKGWDLLKFKFKKKFPLPIIIYPYHRRPYITNYELRKIFKKKVDNFIVLKVLTKSLRIYE